MHIFSLYVFLVVHSPIVCVTLPVACERMKLVHHGWLCCWRAIQARGIERGLEYVFCSVLTEAAYALMSLLASGWITLTVEKWIIHCSWLCVDKCVGVFVGVVTCTHLRNLPATQRIKHFLSFGRNADMEHNAVLSVMYFTLVLV